MAQNCHDHLEALAARLRSDEFDIHEVIERFLEYDLQQQYACAEQVMIVVRRDPTRHQEFLRVLYRLASVSSAQLSALREAMQMASEQLLGEEDQKQTDAFCTVI